MNFSEALIKLKSDYHLRRKGWNGKGMHIFVVWPKYKQDRPYIAICNAEGVRYPWVASQQDVFAEDWELATEERKAAYE